MGARHRGEGSWSRRSSDHLLEGGVEQRGWIFQGNADVGVPGLAVRKTDAALMVGPDAVARSAQRGEIAGLLVAQVFVGAVMRLDGDALATVVAQTAAEASGPKFGDSNRRFAALAAADVFSLVHFGVLL